MHPAPSLIFFTTFSGLGFGLLAFLGLGQPPVAGWVLGVFFALGFGLAGAGLLASTLHLGHPERALLAFTQWRSSWLSREALLAMASFAVMGLYALLAVLFDIRLRLLGGLGSALCLATVYATAMIYAQLKTIPRWNDWSTPALFLTLSLAGGALLASKTAYAEVLLILALGLQLWVFVDGDRRFARAGHTVHTATGLGNGAPIRQFEAPHTGTNYLLKEMVYKIARKHSQRLRLLGMVFGLALPALLMILVDVGHVLALVLLLSHIGGVLALRWLFYAEAEHVVGLYYSARG